MIKMFTEISQWISRLLLLNLCWVIGLLVGLILFGFMPATLALHDITRKWAHGDLEVPIIKRFIQSYRENFIKKNLVGGVFVLVGALLIVNLRFASIIEGTLMMVVYYFILFALFILLMSLITFFNVYNHYKFDSFKQYVQQSIAITVASPALMVLTSIGLGLIIWLFYQVPGLTLFFLGVFPAYWSSIVSKKRFGILEKKIQEAPSVS
ncbi:YesL family protein [Oceanobacillus picturae]|uniref:YesL family protein n=1 Tax=Oceanobacillus picturae TaxID=171693 RepID=UPI003631324E